MIKNWNAVQKNNTKIVWKDLDETNLNEIKNLESILGEPYFCKHTNSVVFKTDSDIRIERDTKYSELELISRYLTTENKLFDLLEG